VEELKDKQVIVNFGHPLSPKLKDEIEAIINREIDERHFNVGINMKKNIYIQCIDIINRVNVPDLPADYVVNLPGLPIAAYYLCVELEARTEQKPSILELHREKDEKGVMSDFRFGRIRSMEVEYRFSAEKYYKNEQNNI